MKKFFIYFFGTLAGLIALTFLFFGGRQLLARIQVEREWQVVPTSILDLETTSRLEILPIYEALTARAKALSWDTVSRISFGLIQPPS